MLVSVGQRMHEDELIAAIQLVSADDDHVLADDDHVLADHVLADDDDRDDHLHFYRFSVFFIWLQVEDSRKIGTVQMKFTDEAVRKRLRLGLIFLFNWVSFPFLLFDLVDQINISLAGRRVCAPVRTSPRMATMGTSATWSGQPKLSR